MDFHIAIKSALAAYGMDEAKLANGWEILNCAIDTWKINDSKRSEIREASKAYRTKYKEVEKLFRRHRDLTRILCKGNPKVQILLGVKEPYPLNYKEFCNKVKQFYSVIIANTDVQNELEGIKIKPEMATASLLKLETMLTIRSNLDKRKEESLTTTAIKDLALAEINEWMEDFNSISKIALFGMTKYLKTLGICIKTEKEKGCV